MDKYDKEILSVLLENGKIQLSELSKKTNLSVSSCQRRVKEPLHKRWVICYN